MSIFIFFAVLFVLVLVHEWGHFIVAKRTDMRVDEFGIGFPPKLFGIKKGETEYTFNALPLGGFVKIFGEDGTRVPSSPLPNEVRDRQSEASAEAGEGGEDILQNGTRVVHEKIGRAFSDKSKWAQAAVLIAGVTMNVLFAWFLFTLAFSIGTQTAVSEADATKDAELVITEVLLGSPAGEVAIPRGSVVVGLYTDTKMLETFTPSTFRFFIEQYGDKGVTLKYVYAGETITTEIVPRVGLIEGEPGRKAVGVALTLLEVVSRPIHIAIWEGFKLTLTSLRDIAGGITGLLWDAVRFQADLSQVAGPVGIVGLVGEASAFGITSLLMFTAFISLNLAVINLLPFPALDGGRLLLVAIEGVTKRPINPVWTSRLNLAGFVLLMLLMVAVTYNDVLRLI